LRVIAPDREPELNLPLNIRKIELMTGKPTRVGEALRRQHRERVEARAKGLGELERVMMRQKEEARMAMTKRRVLEPSLTKRVPRSVLSREERLQQRWERAQADKERMRQMSPAEQSVQRWLKWRQRNAEKLREQNPDQSARNWLAYREAQKISNGRQIAAPDYSPDVDDFGRKRKQLERTKDYGLEF
jgi:hypothetical protein